MKRRLNEWTQPVVVASLQTLARRGRLATIPKGWFRIVIVDECHYANAPSYQRVLRHFDTAFRLGVTATAFRGDRASLTDAGWESVAYVYDFRQAIEDGWLVPPTWRRIASGCVLDCDVVQDRVTREVDFDPKQLQDVVNKGSRNEKIVKAYVEAGERKTIAFCAGVVHAVELANTFRRNGVDARAVYGTMSEGQRVSVVQAHQRGVFPVLTNCNVLTHGYDDPSVSGVIMARPTRSKVLYVQCVGRGLRPHPGKTDCVVWNVMDERKDEHVLAVDEEVEELKVAMEGRQIVGGAGAVV